ncbi:centrosomal and chromosomal factor corto [Anticarsia gemmatalis]|uniref:centrosomal and chromosomal factor corto n=1 Tax=Anticarsia gemmatalis TaxID=129554 RepID=UPI003F75C6EF
MTGYARGEADFAAADRFRRDARPASLAPKDYSVPLHVDCSIEYELPDCAKPPQGVKIEPLLMIHPSHFRRLESLRRVPFVNNLPRGDAAAAAAVTPGRGARAPRGARRCCRAAPAPAAPPPQPQPAARARGPAEEPALCYRFESYGAEGAGGKLAARARLKPLAHPYLPAEALDCDMGRALPPAAHYERFDKRALQQLPIYM